MLCTEFSLLASILSTALHVNTTYSGSSTLLGVPALFYDELGYGAIDIKLPPELALVSFLWNETYANGSLMLDENGTSSLLNISLRDHAFRLSIEFPSGIPVYMLWGAATLPQALVLLNVTHGGNATFYEFEDASRETWYLDFTIRNDTVLSPDEDLIISIPYEWEFGFNGAGYYAQSFDASLTPFDWSYKEVVSNGSYLYESLNLSTDSLAELALLYPQQPQPVSIFELTLNASCPMMDALGNVSYDVVQTYDGLLNCSTCVQPSPTFSIHSSAEFEVVQKKVDLMCNSVPIGPSDQRYVAGDVIQFSFTINHYWWSVENATQLLIELDSGVHCEILSLNVSSPLGNGTLQQQIIEPADGRTWSMELSDYIVDYPDITVEGTAKLRDSLPLQNRELSVNLKYSWSSERDAGITSFCNEKYKSDYVDISAADSYIKVPADWNLGYPAEAFASFNTPAGTIQDVSLEIEFEYDTDLMEVELSGGQITKSDNAVTVSEPLTVTGGVGRRRRAVSSTVLTVNAGTVVNPASRGSPATINIAAQFYPTIISTPSSFVVTKAVLNYASQQVNIGSTIISTIGVPVLNITKETKYGSTSRRSISVTVTVEHIANASYPAYDVVISDMENGFNIDSSTLHVMPSSFTDIRFISNGGVRVTIPEFNTTTGLLVITFEASALGDSEFPKGVSYNDATVSYKTSPTTGMVIKGSVSSCTTRNDLESDSVIYQHGITAAAIIIGFILGLVLVPLVIFLVLFILKKTKGGYGASVQPSATDYRTLSKQKKTNALILDPGQKVKQGFNSAMAGVDDSIVSLLALKDRFTTNRELDNLDIQATVEVDKRMEAERLRAMDDLLDSVLIGMAKNGDISRQQYEHHMSKFRKSSKELDVRLTAEYTSVMEEFIRRRATHNRSKLGGLLDKHRADKNSLLEKIDMLSEEEKKQLIRSVDSQCQIEQDDLSYRLKLEQDEEAEQIRKEFSLKKRIQTKELQQASLHELKGKTEMPDEMASWLMKEHAKNVTHLEKIHDDELCRQKLVLEEKLAKRRALAELSDLEEKGHSELLNTIAGGQVDILKKAKKQKLLTAEEARTKSDEIMGYLLTYKQSMELDMAKQETALHNRLSEQKKKQLAAKIKDQENELVAFDKQCLKQQQDHQQSGGSLNPLAVAEKRLQIVAKNEIDRASTEIQIDQLNATELKELRGKMTQTYKTRLMDREKKLLEELRSDGMRDDQMEAILEEHNSDIETLEARQKQSYQQQDENLKIRLKKRRRDWEKRMAQEQEEKAHLREQEATVVSEIIDSQLTMSADEREKIMREHEKNMIKLENSLTLNKLKQRQILEEKLAERRAKRMQELEQEQLVVAKKNEKRHSDEDEEDQQLAALKLLQSQAEERVAVLSEEDAETNFDEELEKVKLEILQQRAVALREQEDRLGSMVAQLQINKAKELTEIDEKQRAINELKANLIDDLNDRGVMSDIEAEQCLDQHRAQQEKLTRKLDNERDKQEKILKKKLADRLQVREKTLLEGYEDRLKEALDKSPNKIAAKLKKAALLHKRAVAIEEFKTHMEKEISQTLEEMKREHTIKKTKLTQELELRFIASLVQQGKLKRSELRDCLKMLFPAKTNKQLEELINTLYDDKETVKEDESDLLNSSSASMLRERIARSVSIYQGSPLGAIPEQAAQRRPKSSKKKSLPSALDLDFAADKLSRQRLPPLKPLSATRRGSSRPQANSEDF